jgi:hypothetical protein
LKISKARLFACFGFVFIRLEKIALAPSRRARYDLPMIPPVEPESHRFYPHQIVRRADDGQLCIIESVTVMDNKNGYWVTCYEKVKRRIGSKFFVEDAGIELAKNLRSVE